MTTASVRILCLQSCVPPHLHVTSEKAVRQMMHVGSFINRHHVCMYVSSIRSTSLHDALSLTSSYRSHPGNLMESITTRGHRYNIIISGVAIVAPVVSMPTTYGACTTTASTCHHDAYNHMHAAATVTVHAQLPSLPQYSPPFICGPETPFSVGLSWEDRGLGSPEE